MGFPLERRKDKTQVEKFFSVLGYHLIEDNTKKGEGLATDHLQG